MTEICWLLLSNNWCFAKRSWFWICWISCGHNLRVKLLTAPTQFGALAVGLVIQDPVQYMESYGVLSLLPNVCMWYFLVMWDCQKKMERSSGSFLRKALNSLKEEALFDIWYPWVLNASPTLQLKGLQYFLTQRHLESFQWGLAFVSKCLHDLHCQEYW